MCNKVKCHICGESFYKITASHLKKHGLTRGEYIDLFGKQDVDCLPNYASIQNDVIDYYTRGRILQNLSFSAKQKQKISHHK